MSDPSHVQMVNKLLASIDNTVVHNRVESCALCQAAGAGDVLRVASLLDSKADVDARGNASKTSLMYAAQHGQNRTLALLVERKANLNLMDAEGRTALSFALANECWDHNERWNDFYRATKDEVDNLGAQTFARGGTPIYWLLVHGADPNACFGHARHRHHDGVRGSGTQLEVIPLLAAIHLRLPGFVRVLLERGATWPPNNNMKLGALPHLLIGGHASAIAEADALLVALSSSRGTIWQALLDQTLALCLHEEHVVQEHRAAWARRLVAEFGADIEGRVFCCYDKKQVHRPTETLLMWVEREATEPLYSWGLWPERYTGLRLAIERNLPGVARLYVQCGACPWAELADPSVTETPALDAALEEFRATLLAVLERHIECSGVRAIVGSFLVPLPYEASFLGNDEFTFCAPPSVAFPSIAPM